MREVKRTPAFVGKKKILDPYQRARNSGQFIDRRGLFLRSWEDGCFD